MINKQETNLFPLTDCQMAYFIGRNSGIATHAYYEFELELDIQKFEQAVNKVIQRHPMLRAVVNQDGQQNILNEVPYYKIEIVDLTRIPEKEINSILIKERNSLANEVCDVLKWPLFKFKAARIGNKYRLLVSFDLLTADGGSYMIMLEEISKIYEGKEQLLPHITNSFQDYVILDAKRKDTEKYKKDKEYWQQRLKTLSEAPAFARRENLEVINNINIKRKVEKLDSNIWMGIQNYAKENGIIESVLICTIYSDILEYFSGMNRFTLNLTLSDRKKGFENVIGNFTTLMLIEVENKENSRDFCTRCEKMQRNFIDAYRHSSYNGIELSKEFIRDRNLKKETAFPVVFTSVLGTSEQKKLGFLTDNLIFSITQTPQVTLDCQVAAIENQMVVSWDYDANTFSEELISDMYSSFLEMLKELGTNGNVNYGNLIAKAEITQEEYNRSECPYEDSKLLLMIRNSFQKYNKNIAVRDREKFLTYGELDLESNNLAGKLLKKGIGQGSCVAVKGYRNIQTVVNIIAIIKTGSAYVPINPEYPESRIEYILRNSGCSLYLDGTQEKELISRESSHKEAFEDIAYIIYTSGSTGVPKGVEISNSSVCNTIYDLNRRLELTENDKLLCVSSFGFDLSVYDLFGALSVGAEMVIADNIKDSENLKNWVQDQGITIWNSVPAIMELLLDEMEEKNDSVSHILLSGDFIPVHLVEKMERTFPKAALISLGGATEASIWSIYYNMNNMDKTLTKVPYGYPLANQTCYVLNQYYEPCPFYVAGEIFIGGKGVAEGYRNDREKTSHSFLEHPKYGRIYKTGDMGYFSTQGYICILGRRDSQVKINGYRIETGEIEKVLMESKYVGKSFVNVVDCNGHKNIAAYVVPKKSVVLPLNGNESNGKKALLAAKEAAKQIPQLITNDEYREIDKKLQALSLKAVWNAIVKLWKSNDIKDSFTISEFIAGCSIHERYYKIIKRWFDAMVLENKLFFHGKQYGIVDKKDLKIENLKYDYDKIKLSSSVIEAFEDSLYFYENSMLNAEKIVTEQVKILDYLFPEGTWNVAENIYQKNQVSAYYNSILASAVKAYCENRNEDEGDKQPIRILEIGAGTGGTTLSVINLIKDFDVEYWYTDIGNFFVNKAEEVFGKYGFCKFVQYDADISPQEQGFKPEEFDIIIAANVMHDVKNLAQGIDYIYEMLKPGGLVALLELTGDRPLHLVTVGLIDGYSGFSDFREQRNSPLLNACEWEALFSRHGFSITNHYPFDNEKTDYLKENIILAIKEPESTYLDYTEMQSVIDNVTDKLPDYMQPVSYIQVKEFPINHNGKVDYKKLPRPFVKHDNTIIRKPENEYEQKVYELWTELLKNKRLDMEDDFFSVGGDSILMIRFIALYKKKYGVKLAIGEFMEKPTIKEIAKRVKDMERRQKLRTLYDLRQLVDFAANEYGSGIAIESMESGSYIRKTYLNIKSDSNAFSNGLEKIGQAGHHIAIIGTTSYYWLIAFLGIVNTQGIAVPIDPKLPIRDIEDELVRADVTCIAYDEKFEWIAKEISCQNCGIQEFIEMNMRENVLSHSMPEMLENRTDYKKDINPDACCAILFTSGTTGKSKGVMLSQRNIVSDATAIAADLTASRENHKALSILPIHHIFCMVFDCIAIVLGAGITEAICENISSLVNDFKKFNANFITMVPMILKYLVGQLERNDKAHPELEKKEVTKLLLGCSEIVIGTGGAYLDEELAIKAKEYGLVVYHGYGLSEVASTICTELCGFHHKGGTVGPIIKGFEARTDNGELLVKGDSVMMGYYKDPESTAEVLQDGWLRTGDLAYIDDENYVHLTGRKKLLIILSSGENVSPEELEKQISQYDVVKEVIVYQENDMICTQILLDINYVQNHNIEDVTSYMNNIIEEINRKNPAYKHIYKTIIRKEEFEKTAAGKIKRNVIRFV